MQSLYGMRVDPLSQINSSSPFVLPVKTQEPMEKIDLVNKLYKEQMSKPVEKRASKASSEGKQVSVSPTSVTNSTSNDVITGTSDKLKKSVHFNEGVKVALVPTCREFRQAPSYYGNEIPIWRGGRSVADDIWGPVGSLAEDLKAADGEFNQETRVEALHLKEVGRDIPVINGSFPLKTVQLVQAYLTQPDSTKPYIPLVELD